MLEISEVTALLMWPGGRLPLGKAYFLQVHGVLLKRLWTTNLLTQWWSTYQAEGNRAIPWKIREYGTKKYAHHLQSRQRRDFKGNETMNILKPGSWGEGRSLHSCSLCGHAYSNASQQKYQANVSPCFVLKENVHFLVLIYHSRLPKPSPFVMQWNADTHFFCLNPHLARSPAGRCYWQLSLRKYTGWNTDLFEDSGRSAIDFSRAIFHTLPFDKSSKLIEIIRFWSLYE